jgi:hypothetical protein
MTDGTSGEVPRMQRLFDKIWLLAIAAFLFWVVAYLLWGFLDILSVPGVIAI